MRESRRRIRRIPRRASFSASEMSSAQKLASSEPLRLAHSHLVGLSWGVYPGRNTTSTPCAARNALTILLRCAWSRSQISMELSSGKHADESSAPAQDVVKAVGLLNDLEGQLDRLAGPVVDQPRHHGPLRPAVGVHHDGSLALPSPGGTDRWTFAEAGLVGENNQLPLFSGFFLTVAQVRSRNSATASASCWRARRAGR